VRLDNASGCVRTASYGSDLDAQRHPGRAHKYVYNWRRRDQLLRPSYLSFGGDSGVARPPSAISG